MAILSTARRSGQYRTTVATLERLAQALEARIVVGFETGPREAPVRELVSLERPWAELIGLPWAQ